MTNATDWLTVPALADAWGQTERWVIDHMDAGDIPFVRVGRQRFFTPGCAAQMEARALNPDRDEADGWGQVTRSA